MAEEQMPSVGELYRLFSDLRAAQERLEVSIMARFDRLESTYVRQDVHKGEHDALGARVKDLEDWKTWAFRLVIGAVVVALLGLVVVGV
jgi:hypothetical protein